MARPPPQLPQSCFLFLFFLVLFLFSLGVIRCVRQIISFLGRTVPEVFGALYLLGHTGSTRRVLDVVLVDYSGRGELVIPLLKATPLASIGISVFGRESE